MKININVKYNITDLVYVITDPDQNQGVITGYLVDQDSILYRVSVGSQSNYYYGFELSTERKVF